MLQWLYEEGWLGEAIEAPRGDKQVLYSYGFIAAIPEQLELLARRGRYCLMDSTHNTNKLGWQLYTIMARDEAGTWLPGAFMCCSAGDSDIAAAGLRKVSFKRLRSTGEHR